MKTAFLIATNLRIAYYLLEIQTFRFYVPVAYFGAIPFFRNLFNVLLNCCSNRWWFG